MNNLDMSKEEIEQQIADKLNEIVDIANGWHGYDAEKLCFGIAEDGVWGFIVDGEERPLNFWKERKARRATGRIFTPELGEIIGQAVKASLLNNDDNPLCWASDEGVEMLRQKLIFMLQQHDFMLDLKENHTKVTIEKGEINNDRMGSAILEGSRGRAGMGGN